MEAYYYNLQVKGEKSTLWPLLYNQFIEIITPLLTFCCTALRIYQYYMLF